MRSDIRTLTELTSAGASGDALDISALDKDATIHCLVHSATGAYNIEIQGRIGADFSTGVFTLHCFTGNGVLPASAGGKHMSVRLRDLCQLPFNVTNGKLRLNLTALEGSKAVTVESWIEAGEAVPTV